MGYGFESLKKCKSRSPSLCTKRDGRRHVIRQLCISDATLYVGKKPFAHFGISELRELRLLDEENRREKHSVADLMLNRRMLGEALRKKV